MIVKNKPYRGRYKYLIFDFDGTINNTAPGITATFKKVLDMYAVDYSEVDFNRHIGPPLEFSFQELVGGDRWKSALDDYRRIFSEDNAALNSSIYPGIEETLKSLSDSGRYRLSVATSKYQPFAEESLKFLGIDGLFDCVYGQTETRGYKNEILAQLIGDNGWDRRRCLMIGDTCYDIDGARDNGVDILAVTYGFQKKSELINASPDFLADSPGEIAELLLAE